MRINLLLQREPFGRVLEKTLSSYWEDVYEKAYQVHWNPDRKVRKTAEQIWLGNIYLNAIFTPDIDRAAFAPVRNEFTQSIIRWRRPLQKVYVAAALSSWGATWLSQIRLIVEPGIPTSSHQLIVAGNHKIRILNHQQRLVTAILKAGYPGHFFQREIQVRQQASRYGIPVPELLQVSPDRTWFREKYINGTPLNRTNDRVKVLNALVKIVKSYRPFLDHTARGENLLDYATHLHDSIESFIDASRLITKIQKQTLYDTVKMLMQRVKKFSENSNTKMVTALTHGDFQPANILVNSNETWLIDWEYADRRQIGYDALVYGLQSRFPEGLGQRLQKFAKQGLSKEAHSWWKNWPGVDWCHEESRQLSALIFSLEELLLRLEENANPLFTRISSGLEEINQEIRSWLDLS
jgi:hypothetical protein